MDHSHHLGRRAFLARLGVLGAAVSAGAVLPVQAFARGSARAEPQLLPELLDRLGAVLGELSRDTLNGLTTFVVPGDDAYSRAQGTPREEPGAMQAGTTDFMIEALDNFLPAPDQLVTPLATAFTTGLDDTGIGLPADVLGMLPVEVDTVDRAMRRILESDETVPLSLVMALLLNFVATQVNPLSVGGPFLSPFSRLSYADKARAVSLIEGEDARLVALLDSHLPQPMHGSVSGLLRFVGGALVEFPAFGGFSEYAVFDSRTRELTDRPVGWELTAYQPDGPVEGWDEFKGYYQGRTEVGD